MEWNVLKTSAEYKKAVVRSMDIFDAAPDSPEDRELDLLLVLIKDYEDKNIVLPEIDPIQVIKLKMEEKEIKAKDLVPIIGSAGHVSSVLSGRRGLTLKAAQQLRNYFDLPAEIFISNTGRAKILKSKGRKVSIKGATLVAGTTSKQPIKPKSKFIKKAGRVKH
jgi:HTH-type transcriptional regulator / antitoxin HigA